MKFLDDESTNRLNPDMGTNPDMGEKTLARYVRFQRFGLFDKREPKCYHAFIGAEAPHPPLWLVNLLLRKALRLNTPNMA
jgi:hypothetical protein